MEPAANIRWLKRPRQVKRYYVCDKCSVTATATTSPDLTVIEHRCRYTGPTGRKYDSVRELKLRDS